MTLRDYRTSMRRGVALGLSALLVATGLTIVAGATAPAPASAAQDPTACVGQVALTNGSFEQPAVPANTYRLFAQSLVPGWMTTDSRGQIELWGTGFGGVPAAAGKGFAELNANSPSRLFQDVATTPGQTLSWSLKHRGRNGTDVMRVLIGTPTGTLVQSGPNLSDGTTAWGTHTGTYTVPAGQTTTRFAFEAVSSVGGPATGNFLDDITFGTGPCLISTKSVTNLTRGGTSAEVGDVLRYTVTTRNDGGNPALQSISSDVLASGLDYVPGSLRIVSGPGAAALTDATGDDRGDYTGTDRTIRVRLGDGGTASAGGSISVATATSYTFDARVNLSAAGTTIDNEARVAFRDAVADQDRTSVTDTTQTPVGKAADLAIAKKLDTAPLIAGQPIAYTLTATNKGPHTGTGVVLTDTLPAGITGVTVDGASCTTAGATLTCPLPDLAVGDSRVLHVTGTLSASLDPGAALTNSAAITGSLTDPQPANNTATASGTVTTLADVSIAKSFAPEEPVAGQNVIYTLTAHNDGPSDARDVLVTDPLDPDTTFVSADTDTGECVVTDHVLRCAVGTLAPGAAATITVTTALDPQAVFLVQNTATITTSTSDPDPADNASSVGFHPGIVADLAVAKTASAPVVKAGDPLTFTLVVTNKGPSEAVDIVLSDAIPDGFDITGIDAPDGVTCDPAGLECTWASLPSGQSVTVDVHTKVRADAPAGAVTNTASVAAPADDPDTTNNSSSADVTVEQSADLRISKTPAPATGTPGAAQTFVLTVTNDGPSLARDVRVSDPLPGDFQVTDPGDAACVVIAAVVECSLGDLAPGAQAQVTIHGVIAPSALGTVENTATTTSATPDPDTDNNTATAQLPLSPSADVSVKKTTSTPTVPLGDGVAYVVTVRNDGPSVATAVVVDERPADGIFLTGATPSTGTWDATAARWTVGTLMPGQEETLSVTGTTVAEGVLANTVVASSATPDPDTGDLTSSANVTVTPSADLAITKEIDTTPAVVGSRVQYTITVHNNGPSVAADVHTTDPLPAGLIDAATTDPSCAVTAGALDCTATSLAVGATLTYHVAATVDPATAATALSNTASVTAGTADPDPANNSATVTTPITGTPAVGLTKTAGVPVDANGDGRIGAGDTVSYSFTVTNTGPTILTGIAIDDPLLGGPLDCPALDGATLAPAGHLDCGPIAYTLTQADIDAGAVHNKATVKASSPRGPATADATANVIAPMSIGISLGKTVKALTDVDGDGRLGAGDTVAYVFTVRNTGTSTLRNAVVSDSMLGGAVDCPPLTNVVMPPGAEIDCGPVQYTLTQSDIDGGVVKNTASVTASSPRGQVSDTADAVTEVTGTDAVELVKTAGAIVDTSGDGRIGAGDTVGYRFTVRNLGTTTLTALALSDPLLGGRLDCPAILGASLAPAGTIDCGPYTYTLTQADVDTGIVQNTATVTGEGATGGVTDDGSADLVVAGTPEISLVKEATAPSDTTGDGRIGSGDGIDYRFTIRNTGTTSLSGIALTDELLGGAVDCDALSGLTLLPGDEVACGPIGYTLTQADVDAGSVHNTATVAGTAGRTTVKDSDAVDTPVQGTDAMTLQKSAGAIVDANHNGRVDAGDTIAYTFAVHNTGTTTLRSIAVSDPRLTGEVTCEQTTLAPDDMTVCRAEPAVLTQAEIDAGRITNTATATGTGTGADPITAEDSVTTPIQAQPAVALTKTGGDYTDRDGDGRPSVGDTVPFRFQVTNTGAVTLTGITIDDPKLGGAISCRIPDLAPGESAECGPIAYTITADEARDRTVVNAAVVRATAGDDEVTGAASVTVTLRILAQTGGVLTLLPWAVLLLLAGLTALTVARLRRRAGEIAAR